MNLKIQYIVFTICFIIFQFFIIYKLQNSRNRTNSWDDSYQKAEEFISKLNRSEKIDLLYGIQTIWGAMRFDPSNLNKYCVGMIEPLKNDKVDFKGICLHDGASGVRFTEGASISWQSSINLAATFNKKLIYDVGKVEGEECKDKGINIFLSPNVNMMRTPQGGRVWESFGDDPFYTGICASQMIKGIQKILQL